MAFRGWESSKIWSVCVCFQINCRFTILLEIFPNPFFVSYWFLNNQDSYLFFIMKFKISSKLNEDQRRYWRLSSRSNMSHHYPLRRTTETKNWRFTSWRMGKPRASTVRSDEGIFWSEVDQTGKWLLGRRFVKNLFLISWFFKLKYRRMDHRILRWYFIANLILFVANHEQRWRDSAAWLNFMKKKEFNWKDW
jgi:hypothetical protein